MAELREVVDARGRTVRVPRRPDRIVSLVPSITESLFAFGLGDRVVGVTRFCVHPADARERAVVVGGTHDVNVEQLCALRPDFVIANQEENPRELLETLGERVPTFITFPRTVKDGIALLRQLGTLTGEEETAERYAADAEAAAAAARAGAPATPPRVLYLIWRKPWMTVNGDTFVHDMLARCGAVNVMADAAGRYPEVEADEVVTLRPDAIFLSSEPYQFAPEHATEWLQVSGLPAAQLGQVPLVDGELCCWYGTRMVAGLRYLSAQVRALRTADTGPAR